MYLKPTSARYYLLSIELSLDYGLIHFNEFISRLNILYQIIEPNTPLFYHLESRLLGYQKKQLGNLSDKVIIEESFINNTDDDEENLFDGVIIIDSSESKIKDSANTLSKEDEPDNLDFLTDKKGKLSKWEFHKGDADPNPSVPHGHSAKDKKIIGYKLNPYNGKILDKDMNHVKDEGKKFIIELWNDVNFRDFAIEAIEHFIGTNPHYKFKMKNPGRIPQIR